ncbi:hypothetical protein BGZ51_008257 [Haplosporangium sp. Z 767]|nr:hypothetical protein BGZ51_008257 [Haplosporangium sp. Z 767]KAF9191164.1 hypothetical protein BGZ50_009598 [Haplosporangium sp. Z 11]
MKIGSCAIWVSDVHTNWQAAEICPGGGSDTRNGVVDISDTLYLGKATYQHLSKVGRHERQRLRDRVPGYRLVRTLDRVAKTAEQEFYETCETKKRIESQQDVNDKVNSNVHTIFKASFSPLISTRLGMGILDVNELLRRDSEKHVEGGEATLLLEILFPKTEHYIDLCWF